jgi:hypothetical protein
VLFATIGSYVAVGLSVLYSCYRLSQSSGHGAAERIK